MTEHIEEEQLTVDDILAEAKDNPYTQVLNVWNEIIGASKQVRPEPITPK